MRAGSGPGVGIVETSFVQLVTHERSAPFALELGDELPEVAVAYETYGSLNAQRDNCVLVCHALTGDAHAAGKHDPADRKSGWWDGMIGPGRPIDTDRFYVVCPNVLGSRYGTTGPTSIDPRTGQPYSEGFPLVTVDDMVRVHRLLLDALDIAAPHAVIGGSLGGMQALAWLRRYPESSRHIVPVCSAPALTAQALALNAIGRRAVLADLARAGDGSSGNPGDAAFSGLGLARMLAHVSYLSQVGMETRFGREPSPFGGPLSKFDQGFPIETYLDHQARIFNDRFDPLTYLFITSAMDRCNVRIDERTAHAIASGDGKPRVTSISCSTDWLYPPAQSAELTARLGSLGIEAEHTCIDSPAGHDGFLVDLDPFGEAVAHALSAPLS